MRFYWCRPKVCRRSGLSFCTFLSQSTDSENKSVSNDVFIHSANWRLKCWLLRYVALALHTFSSSKGNYCFIADSTPHRFHLSLFTRCHNSLHNLSISFLVLSYVSVCKILVKSTSTSASFAVKLVCRVGTLPQINSCYQVFQVVGMCILFAVVVWWLASALFILFGKQIWFVRLKMLISMSVCFSSHCDRLCRIH